MYKYIFVTSLLVFPAVFLGTVVGQEELVCRGQELNMTDAQKGHIMDCLKEHGIDSILKIPATKLPCFGLCILKKKKLLTEAGKLDHDKILKYINDVMKPDEVKKPLIEGTEKCMKDHGDKVDGNNDPKCMSFMEVGQCVHDLFFEICVVD